MIQLHRIHVPLAAALALVASGCAANGSSSLVDITQLAAGDETCPDGGVQISTGVDDNGDGELSGDEITLSESVCTGAAPAVIPNSLVNSVAATEDDCEAGGTKIQAGLDDGDPGGTANNGTLEPEEVDTEVVVCDPADDGIRSIEAPEGPVGSGVLDLSGGDGSTNDGGDAGYVDLEMEYGTNTGGIRMYPTGDAMASWTFPASVAYDLGEIPAEITTDTTLPVYSNAGDAAVGELYQLRNDERIFRRTATGVEEITGVRIAAGATLTVSPNYAQFDGGGEGGEGGVIDWNRMDVDDDFVVEGTLTRSDDVVTRVDVDCSVFVGASTGVVDLSGADDADGSGERGASFDVDANDGDSEAYQGAGAVFNQARIDTSGGNGGDGSGGEGGYVQLEGQLQVYNTGAIDSSGGNADDGSGGEGGYIYLDSDYSNLYNSGSLNSSGGDAVDGRGGEGGYVEFYNGYFGNVFNTGDIDATGGDATDCTFPCSGGTGGYLDVDVYANTIAFDSTVNLSGGQATRASGDEFVGTTVGGEGGYAFFATEYEDGWYDAEYVPPGDIRIGGTWLLGGGDGERGGDGGYFEVDYDADYVPRGQIVGIYGIASADLSGGDGDDGGGDGGYVEVFADYGDSDLLDYTAGGPVVNHIPFDLSGGDGGDGVGGDAGYFQMMTEDEYGWDAPWQVAVNFGDVTAAGGEGEDDGGEGGGFFLYGLNGVENHGNLVLDGGDCTGDSCEGGDGADDYDDNDSGVFLYADLGDVWNTGTVSANGGEALGATSDGGDAYIVEFAGYNVTNEADISASGGDGGDEGGDAEGIFFLSFTGPTVNTASSLVCDGGAGGNVDGDDGKINIDGQNVTNEW